MTEVVTPKEERIPFEQAKLNAENLIKETASKSFESAVSTTKSVMAKLNRIEEKQRCVRVRMLDWLADKVAYYGDKWSTSLRTMADNIHSPCAIKLPKHSK